MLPPDLFQDRQSAATQQPMTNRHAARNCPGLSEIPVRDLLKCVSGTYRNCCPGLRETRRFVACRKTFCKELDEVRKLRNEIMHFHPDVIEDGDFEQLRRFSRLLEQLDQLAK